MNDKNTIERNDLLPRPDPDTTADFNDALDIVGYHGSGLLFLHSPTMRLMSGYECRLRDGIFIPHPHGGNLLNGKKPMPCCHHGYLPHLLVPRENDRVDWIAFLGTWGDRSNWGDGTEAAYPEYTILQDCVRREDWRWCDGKALEVSARDRTGREAAFSGIRWQFWHGPGFVWFTPEIPHPIFEHIVVLVPPTPFTALINVYLRDSHATVRLEARPLLATLMRPAGSWTEVVDFLDPPFGWGRFTREPLVASVDPRGGLRFRAQEAGLNLVLLAEGHEAEAFLAPVDAEAPARADLVQATDEIMESPCFDAAVVACPGTDRTITFRLGAERLHPGPEEVHIPPFSHTFMASRDGRHPLRFSSGNRSVDGYVRWARITLRSLIWPNGIVATGALGYGGMSHVGQDIPFVYPLLLMEEHHLFKRAAMKNVEVVWKKAGTGAGITDHPSDGLDFAFLPMDPENARVWKATGAAGLCRQIQMLHRYWLWTGDSNRVEKWYARARDAYLHHHAPFRPDHPLWTSGLETQAHLFGMVEAPAALEGLMALAEVFGSDRDRERFLRERDKVLACLDRPCSEGGFRLTEPLASTDGQVLPAGLLVEPDRHLKTGAAFSFDVLLLNALALLRGAFLPDRRAAAVRHLADENSSWWVEGAGLAKSHHSGSGVWFWHNALAVGALLSCRDLDAAYVDTAWKLMKWMGKGVVDLNGRGCPGEEIQGGDHAMAIGCLGPHLFIEGLLGIEASPDGLRFTPVLPTNVDEVILQNLLFRGRLHHVFARRNASGILYDVEETIPG